MSERSGHATYEIRVRGLLGPVLTGAVPHTVVAWIPRQTVVVATTDDGRGLVDVLEALGSPGVEVESITVVDAPVADPALHGRVTRS